MYRAPCSVSPRLYQSAVTSAPVRRGGTGGAGGRGQRGITLDGCSIICHMHHSYYKVDHSYTFALLFILSLSLSLSLFLSLSLSRSLSQPTWWKKTSVSLFRPNVGMTRCARGMQYPPVYAHRVCPSMHNTSLFWFANCSTASLRKKDRYELY